MKPEPPKKKRIYFYLPGFIVLLLIAYVIWVFQFSYPDIGPKLIVPSFTASDQAASLPWPSYGQSAIGINTNGVIASNGKQTPVPMASTAKLITALCVLDKYPITNVSTSPVLTLSQSDVDIYNQYVSKGGSVVPVVAGEKISEYQMIEAMLLPSANNMADSLATWAFGSLSNYSTYANSYVKNHGWFSTHIGVDASGFDPGTTSTANDLVNIGEVVSGNSIISQIVGQKTISGIPIAGTVKNVNSLLGTDNIVGIKTGNTTQAGGVFISESQPTIDDNLKPTIITAVMGAPSLWQAMNDSLKLVIAAQGNFDIPSAVANIKGGSTVIGMYSVPWSKTKVEAIANTNLPLAAWRGVKVEVVVVLKDVSEKTPNNSVVGNITATEAFSGYRLSTTVLLHGSISRPTKIWLLLHPTVSIQI